MHRLANSVLFGSVDPLRHPVGPDPWNWLELVGLSGGRGPLTLARDIAVACEVLTRCDFLLLSERIF